MLRIQLSATSLILALSLGCGAAGISILLAISLTGARAYQIGRDDRVVWLMETDKMTTVRVSPRYADFQTWKLQLKSFDTLEAFSDGDVSVRASAGSTQRRQWQVTPGLLEMIAQHPLIAGSAAPLADHQDALLVSDAFSDAEFGTRRGAVGKSLVREGRAATISGVFSRQLTFAASPDERVDIIALASGGDLARVRVLGHLREGVSMSDAQAELDSLAATGNGPATGSWVVLSQAAMLDSASINLFRGASVAAVLLLAITILNCVHLFVAQSRRLRAEMSVRWALGASPLRLIRDRLARSTTPLAIAIAASVGLTIWAANALRSSAPVEFVAIRQLSVEWQTLLVPALVASVAAAVFAAIETSRGEAAFLDQLRHSRQAAGTGRKTIIAAVYLPLLMVVATILLVAGLVTSQSVRKTSRIALGFDVADLQAAPLKLPDWKYDTQEKRNGFYARLSQQLSSDPRLRDFVIASTTPPKTGVFPNEVKFGRFESASTLPSVGLVMVRPGYFRTIGQRILAGREFGEDDVAQGASVTIISESVARLFGGNASAIGQAVRFGNDWRTVIGVASDVRAPGLVEDLKGIQVYWPLTRFRNTAVLLVRGPAWIGSELRDQIRALDADLVVDSQPVTTVIQQTQRTLRFLATAFQFGAILAMLLAMFGIYAVLADLVESQRSVAALRLALGATQMQLIRQVALRGSVIMILGIVVGILLSYPFTKLLATQLFQVNHDQSAARLVSVAILISQVIGAAWLPLRRIVRADPAALLKGYSLQ